MLEALIEVWSVKNGQWTWTVTLPSFRNARLVGTQPSRAAAFIDASETLGRHTDSITHLDAPWNHTTVRMVEV